MNYKTLLLAWVIFAVSIVYWDMHRYDVSEIAPPLSDCHKAEIRILKDRPMCTKCKLYCEIADENR